jgi:hypothetical protein
VSEQSKPRAVLISDVHYNINTLELADAAMRQAISKAEELDVPLIVAGDLHDTKAMLRAECVNAMINTFSKSTLKARVLIGNHDRINEKSPSHSLEFLNGHVKIYDTFSEEGGLFFIPYNSPEEPLKGTLSKIPASSTVICHQGVIGADMGEYVTDKSAASTDLFRDFRTVSGHYHRAQDIKCGRPRKGAVGLFSYIGTPYTISFSEANDGPKGFRILHEDGSLSSAPTNLRKHIIFERHISELGPEDKVPNYQPGDLVWVKITGAASSLSKLDKRALGEQLIGHPNFKLDKLPEGGVKVFMGPSKQSEDTILDALIDAAPESAEQKASLKKLWRDIV